MVCRLTNRPSVAAAHGHIWGLFTGNSKAYPSESFLVPSRPIVAVLSFLRPLATKREHDKSEFQCEILSERRLVYQNGLVDSRIPP